jgi:hypothetical protein
MKKRMKLVKSSRINKKDLRTHYITQQYVLIAGLFIVALIVILMSAIIAKQNVNLKSHAAPLKTWPTWKPIPTAENTVPNCPRGQYCIPPQPREIE